MTRPDAALGARTLRSLPKVELHVHLEGSVAVDTAIELARRHGEDPDRVLPLVGRRYPSRFHGFDRFVHLYLAVSRLLRSADDLATVAAAFARHQADQGVRYAEVTFTAVTHVRNGMPPRAMWAAVRDGLADGGRDVDLRLVVDARRDEGVAHANETVGLVESADAPVVGLGLTGVEGSYPERDFAVLRRAADRLELGLTVHAGETGSPGNVRDALDDLGADRIGHGIASVHDPALLARLVRDQVPLEVCPSSNVALGVVGSLDEHPFPQLWHAGADVTINSDDPPLFSTTLTDELRHATRLAGLRPSDLAELQRRAARAAFAPRDVRARLVAEIDEWESTADHGRA
ncbi:MAG: adenosine deaminase [Actinobacteria bacterium]|nr:adenosine deaminase [Actinomycetota bacterium]